MPHPPFPSPFRPPPPPPPPLMLPYPPFPARMPPLTYPRPPLPPLPFHPPPFQSPSFRPTTLPPYADSAFTASPGNVAAPLQTSSIDKRPVVDFGNQEIDLRKLLSQVRQLVSQAEESVTQIANLVNLELGTTETSFVSCSYDRFHRMPSQALFQHSLRCSLQSKKSQSKKSVTDVQKIASSLNYRHTLDSEPYTTQSSCPDVGRCTDVSDVGSCSSLLCSGDSVVSSFKVQFPQSADESLEFHRLSKLWREILLTLKEQSVLSGRGFFYKNAPAVVGVLKSDCDDFLFLPKFATLECWAESASEGKWKDEMRGEGWTEKKYTGTEEISLDKQQNRYILPSRYWLLEKEIASWEDLPTYYSSILLEAAVNSGWVRRKDLKDWLLAHSPSYGLVLDSALANHVIALLVFCLRALHREAVELYVTSKTVSRTAEADHERAKVMGDENAASKRVNEDPRDHYKEDGVVSSLVRIDRKDFSGELSRGLNLQRCCILAESGRWLASQLAPLCDPIHSRGLVLGLYKQAFQCAARNLTLPFLHPRRKATDARKAAVSEDKEEDDTKYEDTSKDVHWEGGEIKEIISRGSATDKDVAACTKMESDRRLNSEADKTVAEGRFSLWQIAAAVAAIQERASFEQYRKDDLLHFHLPKYHLSTEYVAIVKKAEEERAKHPNIRAVLEHDGLTWHRLQQQESKNKTREEILAEERDYKRRRMSYRGKKLKRTPLQVMHDIIEGHMEEIVDAGGIGCFTKRPPELPGTKQGFEGQAACLTNMAEFVSINRKPTYDDDSCSERRWDDCSLQERQRSQMDVKDGESRRTLHRDSSGYSRHGSTGTHEESDESYRHESGSSRIAFHSSTRKESHMYDDKYSFGRRHQSMSYDRDENSSATRGHSYRNRFERWECSSSKDRYDELDESSGELRYNAVKHRSRHRRESKE